MTVSHNNHILNEPYQLYSVQKPAWRGSLPYATDGPNNLPGRSQRTSTYRTLKGTFNLTEIVSTNCSSALLVESILTITAFQLTKRQVKHDGSFIQKLEYLGAVGNTTGNPWGGYWITISGDYIFGDETLIEWSTYLCSRG